MAMDRFSVTVRGGRCPVEIRLSPPRKNMQGITSAVDAFQILLVAQDQQHLQAPSWRSVVIRHLAVEPRWQLVGLGYCAIGMAVVDEVVEHLSVPDINIRTRHP